MVIFHSYVSLPEGKSLIQWPCHSLIQWPFQEPISWRYRPYIKPIFQAYVSGNIPAKYGQKYGTKLVPPSIGS